MKKRENLNHSIFWEKKENFLSMPYINDDGLELI